MMGNRFGRYRSAENFTQPSSELVIIITSPNLAASSRHFSATFPISFKKFWYFWIKGERERMTQWMLVLLSKYCMQHILLCDTEGRKTYMKGEVMNRLNSMLIYKRRWTNGIIPIKYNYSVAIAIRARIERSWGGRIELHAVLLRISLKILFLSCGYSK